MNRWKVAGAAETIKAVGAANKARGVQLVANAILNPPAAGGRGGGAAAPAFTAEQRALVDRGGQIYGELCFTCHGTDGFGTPRPESNSTMGPPLRGRRAQGAVDGARAHRRAAGADRH